MTLEEGRAVSHQPQHSLMRHTMLSVITCPRCLEDHSRVPSMAAFWTV